jgi:sortase (surface protein transpeptidase)
MMRYNNIYSWRVIDEVKRGESVYVLDKKEKEVYAVNDITLGFALRIIEEAEKDMSRFDFWMESTDTEDKSND